MQCPQIVAKISVPVGAADFTLVCSVKGAVLGGKIQDKSIVKKPLTYRLSGIEYFGTAVLVVLT